MYTDPTKSAHDVYHSVNTYEYKFKHNVAFASTLRRAARLKRMREARQVGHIEKGINMHTHSTYRLGPYNTIHIYSYENVTQIHTHIRVMN